MEAKRFGPSTPSGMPSNGMQEVCTQASAVTLKPKSWTTFAGVEVIVLWVKGDKVRLRFAKEPPAV